MSATVWTTPVRCGLDVSHEALTKHMRKHGPSKTASLTENVAKAISQSRSGAATFMKMTQKPG